MAAFLLFPIFILSSDFYNYLYAAVHSLAELLSVIGRACDCSVVNGYRILKPRTQEFCAVEVIAFYLHGSDAMV